MLKQSFSFQKNHDTFNLNHNSYFNKEIINQNFVIRKKNQIRMYFSCHNFYNDKTYM